MNRTIRKRGFTLIELIIVILIIGLLVAIAVPAIFGMRRKAKVSDAKAVIKDAVTAVAQLYSDNDNLWPWDPTRAATTGSEMGTDAASSLIVQLAKTEDTDFEAVVTDLAERSTPNFPYLKKERLREGGLQRLSPFETPYTFEWEFHVNPETSTLTSKVTYTVGCFDDKGNILNQDNTID